MVVGLVQNSIFLTLFSFYFLFCYVSANFSMILVWGEPNSISQCNNTGINNFTDCYNLCFQNNDCMISYMNGNDNICYLCGFEAVKNIVEKTYEDEMMVGMKIKLNNTTCQAQYPEEGQIDYGYLQPNDEQLHYYNISYSKGLWTFLYWAATCQDEWHAFPRQKGPWCMKFFYNASSYHNWTDAENQCIAEDATLSGIETSAEHTYINTTAVSEWVTNFGLIWLGGKRVEQCVYPVQNMTICGNRLTVFEWTDGFTTGTDGFSFFSSSSPNGWFNSETNSSDSCLEMWMNYRTATGYLDDANCALYGTYQPTLTMCFSGYVCGKKGLVT